MRGLIWAVIGIAGLAGCVAAPTAVDAPVAASASSAAGGAGPEARKLRPGMSANDTFAIFGPDSGFERNPANWSQSCLSYVYGPLDAPFYVHALFEDDVLIRSTDGHRDICGFASASL